jgi:hypothetical protein
MKITGIIEVVDTSPAFGRYQGLLQSVDLVLILCVVFGGDSEGRIFQVNRDGRPGNLRW